MDFTAKRNAKELARSYFIAAYVMLVVFLLLIVLLIVGVVTNRFPENDSSGAQAMFIFFTPMIASMILGATGQHHMNKRLRYMNAIKLYRENKFFTNALDSLRVNNYDAAKKAYNQISGDKRKFLHGFFIGMELNATDPERLEHAKEKFDIVRGYYDPANVRF